MYRYTPNNKVVKYKFNTIVYETPSPPAVGGVLTEYRKILKLKQYIIDNYDFNLDIDTWGLTTKEKEIARFQPFMDVETIKRSNALFGYEGDKYYFSMDIRQHFGIDKYDSNMIPYWKTETVDAMNALYFWLF